MPTPADARAARERKQKIFVVVGGLFLLALLAIQLPKLMGGSDSTAAETTTTETATVAGETPEPAETGVSAAVALRDTDRPLPAEPGKLRSFGTFDRKDPFVQQLDTPAPAETGSGRDGATGSGGGSAAGGATDEGSPETPSKGFSVGGTTSAAVTVVSVNGVRQVLKPGTAFPAADPVFVLVAEQLRSKSVVVGVAGGAYTNGNRTTRLRIGKPLVLVNTTTGARYRLVLVSVGNGAAVTAQTDGDDAGSSTTP